MCWKVSKTRKLNGAEITLRAVWRFRGRDFIYDRAPERVAAHSGFAQAISGDLILAQVDAQRTRGLRYGSPTYRSRAGRYLLFR